MRPWGVGLAILLLAAAPRAPLPLSTLEGAPLEVSLAPGERALVLHFWASWCPECVEEMPVIDRLAAGCAGSGVRVLFVNVGESAEEARAFASAHGVRGPLVLDRRGAVWRQYAPAGLPANLTVIPDDLRAEAGPREEAAWRRVLGVLGCHEPAALTSDPSGPPRPPASASPGGSPAPGSPGGS
jgi:thiol-disulfide isomerase/thioredoxin